MLLSTLLLVPMGVAIACLVVRPYWLLETLNILAAGIALTLGIGLAFQVLEHGTVEEWNSFLYADALSAWMVLLISVVSLASSIYSVGYFRKELASGAATPGKFREFYVLTPTFIFAMFFVVLANNLGVMWIFLEGTALVSVFLVALNNQKTSLEAAWKYIMLGSVGLVLGLFGTILTYASAVDAGLETMSGLNWSHLMSVADRFNPNIIKLAFIFVLVGYGTKAGIAPMHTWLPDAHSEAPTPTSAMLSGVYLKVALYGLIRFHTLTTQCVGTDFSQTLLLNFGLVSMCVAAPFILVQTNLKRLFAYSSVEHIGVICVGLGLNVPLAVFGALLHMGYHALIKPVLFFSAGDVQQKYHTLDMPQLGSGLLKSMPVTAVLLTLGIIAATGTPPFGLFLSEFTVLAGAITTGHVLICALFLTALVTVFSGFMIHTSRLVFGSPPIETDDNRASCGGSRVAMGFLIGMLVLFSFWLPASLISLIRKAAEVVGGGS